MKLLIEKEDKASNIPQELPSEKKDAPWGYGYGEYLWKRWISLLEDDRKYRAKSSEFRYINPEKFNLAERRAFASGFF